MTSSRGGKHRPTYKSVIIVIAVLLMILAIPLAIVLGRLLTVQSAQIPIVEKSAAAQPLDTGLPSATPTDEDPALEVITKVPDDIHEDVQISAPAPSEAPIYRQVPISESTINILLLGSDTRPNDNIGRSDTMMLLSYNRGKNKVSLVSFMRDSWVQIEGHGWNRINAAYAFGGVGLSINAVNENFNLDIQNYVTIGFEDFIQSVDEIGGIELRLSQEEANYINGLDAPPALHEGVNTLNGAQTLIHARNRHIGNGDFDRVRQAASDTQCDLRQAESKQRALKACECFFKCYEQCNDESFGGYALYAPE